MELKRVKTIGIVYNLKSDNAIGDEYEEYDEIKTIEALQREIEQLGYQVLLFEQNDDFLHKIAQAELDLVFNIAEGKGTTRSRESQVPCLLESLGIPYFGSDPVSLGITLDKYLTWQLLKAAYIAVPELYMVENEKQADRLKGIFKRHRRFIVKPRWEGSSKGIFLTSIVEDVSHLKEQIKRIISRYRQPVIIEEFLEKDEITVGVCGNRSPWLLGMMKITPRDACLKNFIYSQEVKRDWKNKVIYEPQRTIAPTVRSQLEFYAIKAFSQLELKDVARIDFRLDKKNTPRIVDINPLPGLSPYYSDLPILYRLAGKSYSDLIKIILKESFARYGLQWVEPHKTHLSVSYE